MSEAGNDVAGEAARRATGLETNRSFPRPVDIPGFGHDPSKVSAYTVAGYEVFSRIFSPLEMDNGAWLQWSTAAASLGVKLSATTHWRWLLHASREQRRDIGRIQQGTVDQATAETLIQVLSRGRQSLEATFFALWEGYGGEIDFNLAQASLRIPYGGGNYLMDGSFRLLTADLTWARTRTAEQGYRFPVAIWPQDRSFILATALYQDSYYLSSDRGTLALLQTAGLDALEIDRDAALPSVGD